MFGGPETTVNDSLLETFDDEVVFVCSELATKEGAIVTEAGS